jgi:CRISPR-associated protein Cmr5
MAESTLRTKLEQGRAAEAYKYAQEGADTSKKHKSSEYKSYVKKLPMLIKTNGLGAAMSFAFAKGKGGKDNAWGLIYHQITAWLNKEEKHLIEISENDLMKALMNTDSSTYRATTIEVLALLNWMRRFAEGLISKDDNNE